MAVQVKSTTNNCRKSLLSSRGDNLYDDAGRKFLTLSSWRTKQILLPIRPVVTVDEKCLELVKRKVIKFHKDNARFSFWLGGADFSGGWT